VINHSQQPRNPTDNSMFSQIHTRVVIHETTSIIPCRGGGGGLLHSLPPRDMATSKGETVPGKGHRSPGVRLTPPPNQSLRVYK
jgi:hypothetical protein